jgi:hypothetical protein
VEFKSSNINTHTARHAGHKNCWPAILILTSLITRNFKFLQQVIAINLAKNQGQLSFNYNTIN